MRIAIYIIIILTSLNSLIGQEAVISEYYNDSDFNNEWTEILITKDNINLTGYEIRDNTEKYNDGNSWQNGIKFTSNPIWKNLRIGTVIVINHRGNGATDIDPRDGYIEVDAENLLYFDRPSWNGIASLSLQQFGDVIQLRNASGLNVHALAHVKYSSQGDFYKIAGKKIAYVGDCSLGYSISVGNANKLDDYNLNTTNQSGYDTGKSITHHSRGGTKGKANNNPKGSPINYQFWQSLREPDFNSAFLKVTKKDSSIKLNWNKINLPNGTKDYGGYLILKTTDLESYCKPEDGRVYSVGQKVCVNNEVVAFIEGSNVTEFIDKNPNCNATTRYTIFAFNFYDGKYSSWRKEDGRGIAYSDNINESNSKIISLENPFDIRIDSRLGTKFCSIDTTVLFNNIPNELKNDYSYAWYFKRDLEGSESIVIDSKEPGISDSIIVYRPGYYRLEIKGGDGCITQSNTVHIEIIEQPEAYIADESGKLITSDTIIYYCEDIGYKLRANIKDKDPKELIYLYKDGIKISNFGEVFDIETEGKYYYIFTNEDCKDTSYTVEFKKYIAKTSVNVTSLDFLLPNSKNNKIDSLVINNNSDTDFTYSQSDFLINPPFKIKNSFPITIKSNSSEVLYIEFSPSKKGEFYDTLKVNIECEEFSVALFGNNPNSNPILIADKDTIDFGILIQCLEFPDKSLMITNTGDEWILMKKSVTGSFAINPEINNDTIFPGESLSYRVSTSELNTGPRFYNSYIPWISESGVIDTLEVYLKAYITIPSYRIVEDTLDFGVLSACEDYLIDSVHIYNDGEVEIEIKEDDITLGIEIINGPVFIAPGDTSVILLKYSKTSPKKISKQNQFKIRPGCVVAVPSFYLIAEMEDGGYNLSIRDTINFGRFYSCDEINSTKDIEIKVLEKQLSETIFLKNIQNPDDNFDIAFKQLEIYNNIKIPVNFNKKIKGHYESKIILTFEPCDTKKEIVLIAEIEEQLLTYNKNILFNTYSQGNSATNSLKITNTNKDDLIIERIDLPNYVFVINSLNFPIILPKDSTIIIDLELKTLNVGDFKDSLKIITSSPCTMDYTTLLNGKVLDTTIPAGNFIAEFDIDSQITPPKNIINIPIIIKEDIYKFDSVDVETILLELEYPFNAFVLGNISALQSDLRVEKFDSKGKLKLAIKKANNDIFKLLSNDLLNLEFYVLDVVPDDYKFNLKSGEVFSFPKMTITTDDSTNVKIDENCVNNTDFVFVKLLDLSYEIENNNLQVVFNQPTDDSYRIDLIDNTGQSLIPILDGNQSRGEHNINVNISDLSSGIYYLTLFYSNEVLVEKISIIK